MNGGAPTPPLYRRDGLVFTWPTPAQIDAYYDDIVGTDMFDTLLWDGPDTPADLHEFWAARYVDYALGAEHTLSLAAILPGESELGEDRMVGSGSLRPVAVPHGVWNIGYAFSPGWQGRGYGSALVRLFVDIAFGERGVERLEADVFVGNLASRRVLEKAGFTLEGTARSAVAKDGARRDEWRFGMIRADWGGRGG